MADHRRGADAPLPQQLGEGVFDGEESGLREGRLLQPRGSLGQVGARRRIEDGPQIEPEMGLQLPGALVESAAEGRLGVVEILAHAHVLRTLAREEEGDGTVARLLGEGEDASRIAVAQRRGGVLAVAADEEAPLLERLAPHLRRVGDVGNVGGRRIVLQKPGEVVRGRLQGCRRARRDEQELPGA